MNSRTLCIAISLVCMTVSVSTGQGRQARRIQAQAIEVGRPVDLGVLRGRADLGILINDMQSGQDVSGPGGGSASLKTDPDLEVILKKAERYQLDGNYSVACQLWQTVLEKSGDTLYSNDGQVYFSMIEQVEKRSPRCPLTDCRSIASRPTRLPRRSWRKRRIRSISKR
jgi:hypothetical protein